MINHFKSIGFDVESEEDVTKLANLISKNGIGYPSEKVDYIAYRDKSGSEVWLTVGKNKQLLAVEPSFHGLSLQNVSITSEVVFNKDYPDEGGFYVWNKENEQDIEYPFVFSTPHFQLVRQKDLPKDALIRLTGFAHEVKFYESDEAFKASQEGEYKMASESFIPSGTFTPGAEEQSPPRALAIISGRIKKVEEKKNSLSGLRFYWLLVSTLGGDIDVVCGYDYIDELPKVGGIINGEFWLSGKIQQSNDEPEKKSFWKRR